MVFVQFLGGISQVEKLSFLASMTDMEWSDEDDDKDVKGVNDQNIDDETDQEDEDEGEEQEEGDKDEDEGGVTIKKERGIMSKYLRIARPRVAKNLL